MTKAKLKDICKTILNKYEVPSVVTEIKDIEFLLTVFERHPEWSIKVGSGFKCIEIRLAKPYNTRCFVVVRKDSTFTDISYIRAVDGAKSKLSDIKCACRNAVSQIIIDFQKTIDFNSAVCPFTGSRLTSSFDTHIDHYEMTFNELFYKWIEDKDIDVIFSDINDGSKDNETEVYFMTATNKCDFIKFHNANTHLRAVSRDANLSVIKMT